MDENEKKDNVDDKEIEIVTGDSSSLNFSPVYEHLSALKPKPKEENKKKNIIIPEVKQKKRTAEPKEDQPSKDNPEGNKVTIKMDDDTWRKWRK